MLPIREGLLVPSIKHHSLIDPQAGLPMVRMEFAPYTTEVMAHLILK